MRHGEDAVELRRSGLTPRLRSSFELPRLRDLPGLAIFEIAFFFAYYYGMTLSSRSGAPFWFPDSVLLCALLLARPGMWWVYIVAPLPLRLLVSADPASRMWFLLVAFANDSVKGLIAALLMRRALHGKEIRFNALRSLWTYILFAVLVAPALSGLAGASAWAALGRDFATTWRRWFLGDAIANLVCTPLLLSLARDWRQLATVRAARYAEGLALFSALPFAAYVAYRTGIGHAGLIDPFGYIPLPLLVWAAVRFGPAGASAALTIISVLSVAAAGASLSAFSLSGAMESTLSIQLFMLVLAIPILSLSVLVEQQGRTEESLRESEERFRNMADTAPVMIWVSGRDKLCTFVNAAWLAFTGRAAEQEAGSGWAEGVHPADAERCLGVYYSSFDARRQFQMEYRLRRADGEYRWVLDSGVPRFERGGVFAGYIGSCIDITDLKHTQEEALARQKLESLGVMTGGIAHDFNNLLGSILALAELAETELDSGSLPQEEIGRIKAVTIRASEIVRELMVYSGQDKASLEPVDLSRLVKDMLELLKVSISKHARLDIDLQRDLPYVQGSAPQIRQIVMNLIINASEAIGETDGVIRVSTARVLVAPTRAPTSAPYLPPGDYLRLRVSDSGCGMTEETKARVFDPFFTTKFSGRGMGLAVVQGLVRDHGGGILVASAPGKGTLFEIFLPCLGETAKAGHSRKRGAGA